jgi:hypothetical protein
MRLRLVLPALAVAAVAASCGSAEQAADRRSGAAPASQPAPPEEEEEAGGAKPAATPPSGRDERVCGPATETADAELDVVHWSGSAVEPVTTSAFVDIRKVVVSRSDSTLCADIETVEPIRKPSAFFVLIREWGVPDHGWLVKIEVWLLKGMSGARLAYPSAETGPDPRVEYTVDGQHLRIHIPRSAFPDWAWQSRFQWHAESLHVDLENRDFEPHDAAPESCIRVQWPSGDGFSSRENCAA